MRTLAPRNAPTPASPRRFRSRLRFGLAAVAALAAMQTAPAAAKPLSLETDADMASFAENLQTYRGASRVRWVVAAATRASAQAKIAEIELRLPPSDRYLVARLSPETLADAGVGGGPARGWISAQFGSSAGSPACSWQVWVTDPSFPSPGDEPVTIPLGPNDRVPVGEAATFRVGHSGLLQSRLYAFDETLPGSIRDLASAPDVNVPVAAESDGETIVLATSRETAPFLESVRTALADSHGERRDLGPQFALRDKLLGRGRGIGANIQAIPQEMIAPKAQDVVAVDTGKPAETSGKLMETCVYALTRMH